MCTSKEPDADLASAWLDDEEAGVLPNSNIPEMSPAEASERALAKSAWLLDLRSPRQFDRSHASGAISLSAGEPGRLGLLFHFREDFERDVLERFGEGRPSLMLVCEVGVVSRVAADKLLRAGLNAELTVVAGGFEAYCLESNLPLVTSPTADEDAAQEVEDLYNEEFVQSMWSLWDEDEGELPLQPALSMVTDAPPVDASALEQVDEGELEDADALTSASDAAADAPAGPQSGSMLNLAELEDLLGEAPTAPPGAASVAPASAATGGKAPSSLGPPSGDYYSASPSAYGGTSRSSRGVKQRRTRGGLPPAWLVDITHLDFPLLVSSGSVETLSVKELKSWLYHHEGSLSGPKRELVARVKELCPPAQSEAPQSDAATPPPPQGEQGPPVPPLGEAEVANGVMADLPGPPLDGPQDDFLIDEVFSAM